MRIFRCAKCGSLNRVPPPAANAANAATAATAATASKKRVKCGSCKEPIDDSNHPQEVDAEALKYAVEASPVPVLVDFWAPWCGPCRMAAPMLVEIARVHAGDLLVLKLDTDKNERYSGGLGIRSIPTFVVFNKGKEAARQSGLPSKMELEAWVADSAGL